MLLGLCKLGCDNIYSYDQAKTHLKQALLHFDEPLLKAVCAHNLAVANFCEV